MIGPSKAQINQFTKKKDKIKKNQIAAYIWAKQGTCLPNIRQFHRGSRRWPSEAAPIAPATAAAAAALAPTRSMPAAAEGSCCSGCG